MRNKKKSDGKEEAAAAPPLDETKDMTIPPSVIVLVFAALLAFFSALAHAANRHALEDREERTRTLLASMYDELGLGQVQLDMAAETGHAVRVLAVNGQLMKADESRQTDRSFLLRVRPDGHPASAVFVSWLKDRLRRARGSGRKSAEVVILFSREGQIHAAMVDSLSASAKKSEQTTKHVDVRLYSATSAIDELPVRVSSTFEPSDLGEAEFVRSVCTYTIIYKG